VSLALLGSFLLGATGLAIQPVDREQALGKWRSSEQFEGEPRLTFAFKQQGGEIVGWAVLLGQHRKADDHATLALTFHGVRWDTDRLKFETLLPEDEGVIGWELRPTSSNQATLRAVTDDGDPIADDLAWTMAR